jgi:DNA-binding NtrC family response regulator
MAGCDGVARIRIEVPGTVDTELLDLKDGEGVVFGRAPDGAVREPDLQSVRTHVTNVPSVSSTHALVWLREQRIHMRDLGSRNGSWLRLPTATTMEVPSTEDVHLRLGFPSPATAPARQIEPPHYSDPAEFGSAVARAVQNWLVVQDIRASVIATRDDAPTNTIALPLASGERMVVIAERTVDDQFHELMVPVARFVAAQNAVYSAEQETRNDGMILASPAIRQVHRRVVEAAMQNTARVVLLGPSGTGKERLARAYHRHLGRSGPLITVNCATLSRDRIVADLFGAEAGAYTGAQRAVIGAVERADGGTLFLDEIGEMPLDVQSQLLRFLDTGEYQRLGATGVTRVASVHVVAATNRDLRVMVSGGTFRLDLFFRLALEIIEVPSLRERFTDAIAYLSSQQLAGCSALDALQAPALEQLRQHAWPGNFRELVNLVQRLPRSSTTGSIDVEAVRRILNAGALVVSDRIPTIADESPDGDWLEWVREAAAAFCASQGGDGPQTWSDMTTFIEQYLKPYALVHMAGVAGAEGPNAVAVSKVADTVKADRGTVIKQVRRFFDSRRE